MSELVAPRNWMRIGLWLVGATMAYNVVEAVGPSPPGLLPVALHS